MKLLSKLVRHVSSLTILCVGLPAMALAQTGETYQTLRAIGPLGLMKLPEMERFEDILRETGKAVQQEGRVLKLDELSVDLCGMMGYVLGRQTRYVGNNPDRATVFAQLRDHVEHRIAFIERALDFEGRCAGAYLNALYGIVALPHRDTVPSVFAPMLGTGQAPVGTETPAPPRDAISNATDIAPGAAEGAVPSTPGPVVFLDGTYIWQGTYSVGITRTVQATVGGGTIKLVEHNSAAVEGRNISVALTGGVLEHDPSAPDVYTLTGSTVTGGATWEGGGTELIGDYWVFQTRDGGKTFSLQWRATNADFGDYYAFGPRGDEFQHGAATAWTSIDRR